jgi:hypothetical protein
MRSLERMEAMATIKLATEELLAGSPVADLAVQRALRVAASLKDPEIVEWRKTMEEMRVR